VVSVNVAMPRTVPFEGRLVTTAIWKSPVAGRVRVEGVNLAGDEQADRRVHGGPDKAVYAYAAEDYRWWGTQLELAPGPGTFGDNLTVEGVDVTGALVGERWAVGTAVLEVAQPRIPCYKLGLRMGDQGFPRRFAAAGRPGAYLRIVLAGKVGEGDEVRVVHRPAHQVTVGTVERAYHGDRDLVGLLPEVAELPASWREWAWQRLRRRSRPRGQAAGGRSGVPPAGQGG
jgi:MOSC domain-containing protein YiiM